MFCQSNIGTIHGESMPDGNQMVLLDLSLPSRKTFHGTDFSSRNWR